MQAAVAYQIKKTPTKIIVTLERSMVDEQHLTDWLNYLRLELFIRQANLGAKVEQIKSQAPNPTQFDYAAYRERILNLGIWTDEDISPMEEARQHLNNWQVKEW